MEKECNNKDTDMNKISPNLIKSNDFDKNNFKKSELEKKLKEAEQKIESLKKILKDKNIYIKDINND